jgi:putative PIN family toxin of toxin-antitoxin system
MRVVIDTNVLVSAALKDRDPELVVLFVAENPDFEWIVSRGIIDEYIEVLSRKKFGLSAEIKDRWRSLLLRATTCVETIDTVDFPRDQKDARFLACAISGGAAFFITGDKGNNGDVVKLIKFLDTRGRL